MKRSLRRVGTAVMVLIVLLLANITYIQVVQVGVAYRADPNNSDAPGWSISRPRGQITAAGGVVLARSDPSNDTTGTSGCTRTAPMYRAVTGYFSLAATARPGWSAPRTRSCPARTTT